MTIAGSGRKYERRMVDNLLVVTSLLRNDGDSSAFASRGMQAVHEDRVTWEQDQNGTAEADNRITRDITTAKTKSEPSAVNPPAPPLCCQSVRHLSPSNRPIRTNAGCRCHRPENSSDRILGWRRPYDHRTSANVWETHGQGLRSRVDYYVFRTHDSPGISPCETNFFLAADCRPYSECYRQPFPAPDGCSRPLSASCPETPSRAIPHVRRCKE